MLSIYSLVHKLISYFFFIICIALARTGKNPKDLTSHIAHKETNVISWCFFMNTWP